MFPKFHKKTLFGNRVCPVGLGKLFITDSLKGYFSIPGTFGNSSQRLFK